MTDALFFKIHSDLPREGPGAPEDVAWAFALAPLPEGAAICDAGSGPGGDVAALLAAAPGARVTAIDTHEPFIAQLRARFAAEPRVTAQAADLGRIADLPEAPFDAVWCAGALYFLGIEDGLAALRKGLKPGGIVAFSEPFYATDVPSDDARAFWDGYPTDTRVGILDRVAAAGFEVLGAQPLSDAAWEAYYGPMEARIAELRPGADADLSAELDVNAAEAQHWRRVRGETGYLLVVARAP